MIKMTCNIFMSSNKYVKAKYHSVFWGSNFEAMNLFQKADLNNKIGKLFKI